MAHKFNVGQIVELEPGSRRSAVLGPYEIRHLIPASDRDPDDPCYRIKSIAEKHEHLKPCAPGGARCEGPSPSTRFPRHACRNRIFTGEPVTRQRNPFV